MSDRKVEPQFRWRVLALRARLLLIGLAFLAMLGGIIFYTFHIPHKEYTYTVAPTCNGQPVLPGEGCRTGNQGYSYDQLVRDNTHTYVTNEVWYFISLAGLFLLGVPGGAFTLLALMPGHKLRLGFLPTEAEKLAAKRARETQPPSPPRIYGSRKLSRELDNISRTRRIRPPTRSP